MEQTLECQQDVVDCDHSKDILSNSDGDHDQTHSSDKGVHMATSIESECSNSVDTPGGSRKWLPTVPNEIKPKVDAIFSSLDEAVNMYECYADHGGFEVRNSTITRNADQSIRIKYLVCSKYGNGRSRCVDSISEDYDSKKNRNAKFKVTGCGASVRFQRVDGTSRFHLYFFEEGHNHPLLGEVEKSLTRKRRQLDYSDQEFIINASSSNIGPSKVHKLQVALKGGHENVGCSNVDYKNFWRDVNGYVGNKDAQMLLDMMEGRKMYGNNFTYEHSVDNKQLTRLFWADELAKANYSEFGDVISMDATYRTNKYAMIFVPITGVDNHKKSFIVGAALLDGESIELYKWMLEAFLRSHGKEPRIILTDQDPSLIQAIPSVFPNATHRLCMWHIMNKVNNKVGSNVPSGKDFKSCLHKLVWNVYLNVEEFEDRWKNLIEEFQLQGNKWLSDIYNIRKSWIPAYFRNIPLCGLMKTTSRSESSNSYFNTYSSSDNSFVRFMVCFDTALDKQRYNQRTLDHETRTTTPKYRTHLEIERNATLIYTWTVFLEVQNEIFKAVRSCSQWTISSENGLQTFTILQKQKSSKNKLEFKVVRDESNESFDCSCFRFRYHGVLCRHIFTVFITLDIEKIPEVYITRRWRRDIIFPDLLHKRYRNTQVNDEIQQMCRDGYLEFDHCIDRLLNNKESLACFFSKIHMLRIEVDDENPKQPEVNKKAERIKRLLGISQPETVEVYPPTGIKNKGCGRGKRLIGIGEKIAKQNTRAKRRCRTCGILDYHDSRTCTKRNVEKNVTE